MGNNIFKSTESFTNVSIIDTNQCFGAYNLQSSTLTDLHNLFYASWVLFHSNLQEDNK